MTAKMLVLLLSIIFLGAACFLLADPTRVEPPNLTPATFLYHFQQKGFDPQGHGAFVGNATKATTLPDGSVIYDGFVMLTPKRVDSAIFVSIGPEITLPNGKKVGQLGFGSFRMAFDAQNEFFFYRNGMMTIGDREGRSLAISNN